MNRFATFLRDYAFARFFLPLGLGLIVFGIVLYGITDTRKNYPKTEAEVSGVELYEEAYDEGDTHHEATYRIFVKYTVDGQEYEEEFGVAPEMKVGTTVQIDYNPSDPTDISQPTGFWLPIAMIAGGIAAMVAGCISIYRTRKKNAALRKQEEEWKNG